MAAWESKQAKNARKAGGLGLVAVSLAACGSSSSSDPDPVDPVDPVPVGQTFTLTIDADTDTAQIEFDDITGTDGDDTFNATLALWDAGGTTGQVLIPELQGGDVIDGGEGHDVLNATLNGNFGWISGNAPTITNVEVINIQVEQSPLMPGMGSGVVLFDFQNVEGTEELWMVDTDDNGIGSGPVLVAFNIQDMLEVGMRDVDSALFVVSYDAGVLGEGAEQVVNLDNVNDSVLWFELDDDAAAGVGIETLTINSAGDNEDITFDGGALGSVETINVFGDGGSLDLGEDFDDLILLNADEYDGDLTIDLSGALGIETVLTGGGDDRVVIDASVFEAAGDGFTIAMGGGDDTMSITGDVTDMAEFDGDTSEQVLSFSGAAISGVETLELDMELDQNVDVRFDMEGLNNVTTVHHTQELVLDDVRVVNGPSDLTASYDEDATYGTLELDGVDSFTAETDGGEFTATLVGTEDNGDYNSISTLTLSDTSENGYGDFDVTLENMDDLSTINLNGVITYDDDGNIVGGSDFTVDAGNKLFEGDVTINVGDLETLTFTASPESTGTDLGVRETFTFTGDDIGDVTITNFEAGAGANRDRLDFSEFEGVGDTDDVNIVIDGSDAVITAADGQFEGTITLSGVDDLNAATESLMF